MKKEYNDECVSPSDAEKTSDRERTVMVSILICSMGVILSPPPLTLSTQFSC